MAARGSRPIWVACALLVLLLAAAAPADAKSKKKSKKSSKPTSAFGGRDRHAKISKASLALFNAIEDAKPDEVSAALDDGAGVDAIWESHPSCTKAPCTPLHAAVATAQTGIIMLLADKGAALDARDTKQRAPLHLAAAAASADMPAVISQLITLGADVEATNKAGVTPLYVAVTEGRMANCVALLEGGADPNTRAPEANTALQTAVFWSQTEVAELLIERGAAVGVTNKKGKTLREMMNPKMLVALEGKLAAVEAKVEL